MTSSTDTADSPSTGTPAEPAETPTALIPRTVLFGDPHRASPAISPDGQRLAWLAPHEGVRNVWVCDLDDPASERPVTDDRDRGVQRFVWAPDSTSVLYWQDQAGDECWQLRDVHLDTGRKRDLTPGGAQSWIVKMSRRRPGEILVAINADDPRLHDVYRLDLSSRQLTKVATNPGFMGFVADEDFQVRAALAPRPDGGMTVLVRDDAQADWRALLEVDHEDAMSTAPVAFSGDGRRLLCLTSHQANAARLMWLDVVTGEQEVVAGDPIHDVSMTVLDPDSPYAKEPRVALHPDTNEPRVVVVQRERSTAQILDPAVADDITVLTGLGGDLDLLASDDSDRLWVVATRHDDGPIRYYLYRRDTRRPELLFTHQPDLERYELAPMEPFTTSSRDGLDLHGYLSFPPSLPRRNLPAVLLVHGGPWHRDRWGFDPQAQLLANRGYLAIQVNFRGSSGYGKQFLNAGNRQWAAGMHDDLLDTLAWAIGEGYVDPDRVAIFGGSYGGYAALVGAAFTPDVFACALSVAGPTNLVTLIRQMPPYWMPMRPQLLLRVGNPDSEEEFLLSRSPSSRVGDIRVPVLIAEGTNDPRVRVDSEQFVAALRHNGVEPTYLPYPDEGHGLVKPATRLEFFAALEAFLARHLGGRAEPTSEDPAATQLRR